MVHCLILSSCPSLHQLVCQFIQPYTEVIVIHSLIRSFICLFVLLFFCYFIILLTSINSSVNLSTHNRITNLSFIHSFILSFIHSFIFHLFIHSIIPFSTPNISLPFCLRVSLYSSVYLAIISLHKSYQILQHSTELYSLESRVALPTT